MPYRTPFGIELQLSGAIEDFSNMVSELTKDRMEGIEHLRNVIKEVRGYLEILDETTYGYAYSVTELQAIQTHLIPTLTFC